jgi:hypothetical protein
MLLDGMMETKQTGLAGLGGQTENGHLTKAECEVFGVRSRLVFGMEDA